MFDFTIVYTVAAIWAVAAMTPGPNFFITVHTAIGSSRKNSLYIVLGIVTGTLVWSVSGYLGIAILFNTVPVLYFFLKIIGGLYLVYIGVSMFMKRNTPANRERNTHPSALRCFRLGLLTNLLNPKTAAFMTSLFAATIPPNASVQLGVIVVVVICTISAVWYALVSLLFSHEPAKKLYERQKRTIEKIAGAIFIAFGLKLAFSK
ncbi:MAG: lysine transporter LysE [Desulfobulbaceae bacterium]|nr:MAG: lysine transporter LysE [Desulfobulbaceae bacterium]